jgi:deoxyribonuclease V
VHWISGWPRTADELRRVQEELAAATPPAWTFPDRPPAIGGCAIRFPRGVSGPGASGDPAWAAAAVLCEGRVLAKSTVAGPAGAPYQPGLLALREGPLLEQVVAALTVLPDVLLVDATGRDHPRRAGLALHLGAVLGLPTVGVTHRPLLRDRFEGAWVETAPGARPVAVHAGWRTSVDVAVAVVLAARGRHRTPEPLRHARHLARVRRSCQA